VNNNIPATAPQESGGNNRDDGVVFPCTTKSNLLFEYGKLYMIPSGWSGNPTTITIQKNLFHWTTQDTIVPGASTSWIIQYNCFCEWNPGYNVGGATYYGHSDSFQGIVNAAGQTIDGVDFNHNFLVGTYDRCRTQGFYCDNEYKDSSPFDATTYKNVKMNDNTFVGMLSPFFNGVGAGTNEANRNVVYTQTDSTELAGTPPVLRFHTTIATVQGNTAAIYDQAANTLTQSGNTGTTLSVADRTAAYVLRDAWITANLAT
jgi:hypothetical protein